MQVPLSLFVFGGWRMTGCEVPSTFHLRDACLDRGGVVGVAGGAAGVVSNFIELIKVESCLLFPLESLRWP